MLCYNLRAVQENRLGGRRRHSEMSVGGGKSEHYRAASQLTTGRVGEKAAFSSRVFFRHDDKCNRKETSLDARPAGVRTPPLVAVMGEMVRGRFAAGEERPLR